MRTCDVPLALLAAAALHGVAPLAAQTSSARVGLERFRDSLSALSGVATLGQLEADLITQARKSPDDPLLHLRLGFVALRLGQVTEGPEARRHHSEAAGEFEWATQLAPSWPYGWYGLGLAELGVGDSEVTLVQGLQTMLGKDALTRSADAFARSAEVDPTFVLGLVELSNTALRQRVNVRMEVALAALRRAARTTTFQSPELLLARARVERVSGSLDSAVTALSQLLHDDSTNDVARYELARTELLQGDSLAAAQWFEVVGNGDSTVTRLARQDMMPILPDSTLIAFDRSTAAERASLLRTFWAQRDADALHPPGARLAEHFRRLDFAQRVYRLVSERRQFDIAERFRSGQVEYDDRGVIYIRHGEPDARAQYATVGVEPNESWLYHREDGDMVLHFVARQDVQDFRLVESVLDILPFAETVALREAGTSMEGNAASVTSSGIATELLRSREALSPVYTRLLTAGKGSFSALMTEERAAGRRAIARAASTDSWPLDFATGLDADVAVLAVGADSGGGHIQITFAVPASEVTPQPLPGGTAYPVRTRATVLDQSGRVVARLDTTRSFYLAEQESRSPAVMGHESVRVPAGSLTVRVVLETESRGMTTPRDSVRVASARDSTLLLSDIAMGARSLPLHWSPAPGDTAWFRPLPRFTRTEPMQLYFELSGLAEGSPYRLRIRVVREGGGVWRRLFGGGKELTVESEAIHSGGIERISRGLSLDELPAGDYRLEIRVDPPHGRSVTRSREFRVVDP